MKKILLCLLLVVAGCTNGYTLIRSPESDVIKMILLVDEQQKELVEGLQMESVQIRFCSENCAEEIKKCEHEYVDVLAIYGQRVMQAIDEYENVNHIPILKIIEAEPLDSLRKLFPEYVHWEIIHEEAVEYEQADAYYIDEGLEVMVSQPFYQNGNEESLCSLILDKGKFQAEIEDRISLLLNSKRREYSYTVEWKIK